jgi:hypothetical protein
MRTTAYGLRAGGVLVERELEVVSCLLEMHDSGVSQYAIATRLNSAGYRSREGVCWSGGAVGRVVNHEAEYRLLLEQAGIEVAGPAPKCCAKCGQIIKAKGGD